MKIRERNQSFGKRGSKKDANAPILFDKEQSVFTNFESTSGSPRTSARGPAIDPYFSGDGAAPIMPRAMPALTRARPAQSNMTILNPNMKACAIDALTAAAVLEGRPGGGCNAASRISFA